MQIYKYRDLSSGSDDSFERLRCIVEKQLFWCSSPSTLNDPVEFVWEGDYSPTSSTPKILATVLTLLNGVPAEQAERSASDVIKNGRLESVARPIFEEMIAQCRREIGLSCFGKSPSNDVLWKRYGGEENGVCIEIEMPDSHLNSQFHAVQYPSVKRLHVDQLLSAASDRTSAKVVYEVSLLSKPPYWASEEEVRFLSKQQNINVRIAESRIARLILGRCVSPILEKRITDLALSLPYELQVIKRSA